MSLNHGISLLVKLDTTISFDEFLAFLIPVMPSLLFERSMLKI